MIRAKKSAAKKSRTVSDQDRKDIHKNFRTDMNQDLIFLKNLAKLGPEKFQKILDKFGPGLDQKSWTSSDLNQHISKLKDRLGLGPKKFCKSRIGLSPADLDQRIF